MHILITGGEGFIGGYIKRNLTQSAANKIAANKTNAVEIEILETIDTYDIKSGEEKDILNIENLAKIITTNKIDSVFHCAAKISVPESFIQKEYYDLVNINGTENVFNIVEQNNTKIVFSSSAAVYGECDSKVKEDFVLNPQSPYADEKKKGEEILARGAGDKNMYHIALRYFNVYGPGQSPEYAGVITHFIRAALKGEDIVIFGNGNAVRDFVFVEDVARANVMAMNYPNTQFEIFNIGSGAETKVKDLAEMIIKLTNSPSQIVYKEPRMGDIVYSCADVSKAKSILGFETKVSLEEGLKKTIEYFRTH